MFILIRFKTNIIILQKILMYLLSILKTSFMLVTYQLNMIISS